VKKTDTIVGSILLLLGIGILAVTFTFKQTLITDNYLGAAFFPRLIAVVLILFSSMLISSGLKQMKKQQENESSPSLFSWKMLQRPVKVIVLLLVYYILLNYTGFCITSTLLFWSILFMIKAKRSYYLIAPVFVGIVFAIFRYLFLVQLPTGFVGF
jgi:hypothetical protein